MKNKPFGFTPITVATLLLVVVGIRSVRADWPILAPCAAGFGLAQVAHPTVGETSPLPVWNTPVLLSITPDDTAATGSPAAGKDWRIIVAPYVWAASLKGDVTVRGNAGSVDASFVDVLEKSDSIIGLQGHVELWKGQFGVFFDGTYLKIGVNDALASRLEASVISNLAIVEFGGIYRVGEWNLSSNHDAAASTPSVAFDALAGGRYTYLGAKIDFERGPSASQDRRWVDPLIGGRVILDPNDRLQLSLRGDIGGFGVGSDFAWSATGLIGYKLKPFGMDATAYAGYRALYQDYQDGSGRDKFNFDVLMYGPILGVAVRF